MPPGNMHLMPPVTVDVLVIHMWFAAARENFCV